MQTETHDGIILLFRKPKQFWLGFRPSFVLLTVPLCDEIVVLDSLKIATNTIFYFQALEKHYQEESRSGMPELVLHYFSCTSHSGNCVPTTRSQTT